MLNEFYPLNKTYVIKRDGNADTINLYTPVSMYFRKNWSQIEMFNKLKEIAETAVRYYIF